MWYRHASPDGLFLVRYTSFEGMIIVSGNRCIDSLTVYWQDVADLKQQFPELAGDVTIPQLFPDEQFFSSVLRVSSASLHLWTHYDV